MNTPTIDAPDAVERLRERLELADELGLSLLSQRLPARDARATLAHIDALAAERDAARAELAQWKAEIVAWLRGDEAQLLANTHPACMTDLAEALLAADAFGRGDV